MFDHCFSERKGGKRRKEGRERERRKAGGGSPVVFADFCGSTMSHQT
jgi:hypothetical protein